MSLLTELLEQEPETRQRATPATFATRNDDDSELATESSKSSTLSRKKDKVRTRLLKIAEVNRYPPELMRWVSSDDLKSLDDASGKDLAAFLKAVAITADREEGIVPGHETGTMLCQHCGPVYIDPGIARQLPLVGGWPTAAGCPWCHISNRYFPRPGA